MLNVVYKLNNHLNKDSIFWFCAFAGSGLGIIQFILNLLGTDHQSTMEDSAAEFDAGKFKWLTKQALTGFLMMFGWVGLTCQKEFGLSGIISTLIAIGMGLVAILMTGFIFKTAKKLRSSGTVFRLEDAIGKEAFVYQRIPKDGIGKVSVSLQNFTHEIDAISLNQEDISSFTPVQIIKKADEKTVVVVSAK